MRLDFVQARILARSAPRRWLEAVRAFDLANRGSSSERDTMPVVRFAGAEVSCARGANLRRVLLNADLPLYNPPMRLLHCRGFGTCGTCAVRIDGEVSPMTAVERWRLSFPPHTEGSGLRLACQCEVLGSVDVTKFGGRWGQAAGESPVHGPEE